MFGGILEIIMRDSFLKVGITNWQTPADICDEEMYEINLSQDEIRISVQVVLHWYQPL